MRGLLLRLSLCALLGCEAAERDPAKVALIASQTTNAAPAREANIRGDGPDGEPDAGACSGSCDARSTRGAASSELAQQRDACAFGAGAHVRDTLGVPEALVRAMPIRHVVVLMKENRAFDHLWGALHDQGVPDVEPIPESFTNRDAAGAAIQPFRSDTTCIHHDPDHQWAAMHAQVNDGAMDGFVTNAARSTKSDGHFVMGHYEQDDLPFYYWLARTFSINDRHFASVRSGTFPNRNFLLLGTAAGVRSTGKHYPDPSLPTLFDSLRAANLSWGVYAGSKPFDGSLGWSRNHEGVQQVKAFLAALDDGSLPAVAFVDGVEEVEDEHPKADVQRGEAWTRDIYTHAVASALWPELAIVWTYDEGGGFADHVPPPQWACLSQAESPDNEYFELGVRVPLTVISAWARPHFVSHVVQEHTAVTRFIEAVFDLPALSGRDANSDALLDMFDFSQPALLEPPAAPKAGTGGCH